MVASTDIAVNRSSGSGREIDDEELDLLATGAWILGTGGGAVCIFITQICSNIMNTNYSILCSS